MMIVNNKRKVEERHKDIAEAMSMEHAFILSSYVTQTFEKNDEKKSINLNLRARGDGSCIHSSVRAPSKMTQEEVHVGI
jgi:hypothetical protein